jgi:hypothetical protein
MRSPALHASWRSPWKVSRFKNTCSFPKMVAIKRMKHESRRACLTSHAIRSTYENATLDCDCTKKLCVREVAALRLKGLRRSGASMRRMCNAFQDFRRRPFCGPITRPRHDHWFASTALGPLGPGEGSTTGFAYSRVRRDRGLSKLWWRVSS